jgi:hypothetical protein
VLVAGWEVEAGKELPLDVLDEVVVVAMCFPFTVNHHAAGPYFLERTSSAKLGVMMWSAHILPAHKLQKNQLHISRRRVADEVPAREAGLMSVTPVPPTFYCGSAQAFNFSYDIKSKPRPAAVASSNGAAHAASKMSRYIRQPS